LVCISVQKPQPSFISSCVAAGTVDSETTLPAETTCFPNLAATQVAEEVQASVHGDLLCGCW
jgi:hypothetical protein